MISRAMDSLEVVEMVMLVEEIFGTDIPDNHAEHFGSPPEIVNWLEPHLSNQRRTGTLRSCSEDSQKLNNDLNWLRGWTEHGGESKLLPSSAKYSSDENCSPVWRSESFEESSK
jgi:hypothetical protein